MNPDLDRTGEGGETLSEEYQSIDAFLQTNVEASKRKGFAKLKVEVRPKEWKLLARWLANDLFKAGLEKSERDKIFEKYRLELIAYGAFEDDSVATAAIASRAIAAHTRVDDDGRLPSGYYPKESGRTYDEADAAQRAAGDYDR
jgi:hypothetical protein